MPDVDGTGFGSFLEPDACSHLLKICNLKVHMEGTYCIISNRADQKKKRYHLARATVASWRKQQLRWGGKRGGMNMLREPVSHREGFVKRCHSSKIRKRAETVSWKVLGLSFVLLVVRRNCMFSSRIWDDESWFIDECCRSSVKWTVIETLVKKLPRWSRQWRHKEGVNCGRSRENADKEMEFRARW